MGASGLSAAIAAMGRAIEQSRSRGKKESCPRRRLTETIANGARRRPWRVLLLVVEVAASSRGELQVSAELKVMFNRTVPHFRIQWPIAALHEEASITCSFALTTSTCVHFNTRVQFTPQSIAA